ncbi:MAG: hypothetical protein KDA21_06010 [Phycisphaerales bacterium]|nr:hypothetical protein [Phycisphaerales bacterium]
MSIVSILLPLLILPIFLVMILAVFFMVRASIGRGWGPVFRGMRCGRGVCGNCGHEVSLPRLDVCPECGAPYEVAGVATRAAAIRLGPPMILVTLILFATAAIFSLVTTPILLALVTAIVPAAGSHYLADATARPIAGGTGPAPVHEVHIVLDMMLDPGERPGGTITSDNGTVTMELVGPDARTAMLEFDRATSSWTMTQGGSAKVTSGEGIDAGIRSMYDAAELDWPAIAGEREAAAALASSAITAGVIEQPLVTTSTGASLSVTSNMVRTQTVGPGAVWLILTAVLYQALPLFLLIASLLWINAIRRRALGIEVMTSADEEEDEVLAPA